MVTVHVNTDFGLSLGAAELTELTKLRAMGELSRRTLWLEAKRRAILAPIDPDEEEERLMEEGQPLEWKVCRCPASRVKAAS